MNWRNEVRRRFEHAGRPLDDSVAGELSEHAADLAADARRAGASETEAAARACAAIDAWARAPQAVSRRRPAAAPAPPPTGGATLSGLVADVRFALRLLGRRPGPALLSVLTIALGVAAVTVMASLAWSILFKPLPWPDGDRLVRLVETRQGAPSRFGPLMTNATWLAWRDAATTIDALGAWQQGTYTLGSLGAGRAAERVVATELTTGVATIVGARPVRGRLFTQGDERDGAAPVAILTFDTWTAAFGSRDDVIGRTIRLDGASYTIVGVLAKGVCFPDRRADLWLPLRIAPVVVPGVQGHQLSFFHAMARLRPGVTPAQAAAEASARGRAAPDPGMVLIAVFGSRGPLGVIVEPALDALTREVRPGLLVLLAAVVLLLACAVANVANVQLTRATGRRREMGIRAALGAGTGRLARQLLVEHVLLGVTGGLGGLALARVALIAVPHLLPATMPRVDELSFGWPVALLALACAAGAGIAVGVLPAWQVRRLDLVETLAEDGLAPSGSGLRLRSGRLRAAVTIAQVAAATVLLVGGALLTRSFVALATVDRGIDTTGVLSATIPSSHYTAERRLALLETLATRMRLVPGVRSAGYTNVLPLTGSESIRAFEMPAPRGAASPTAMVQAAFRVVSPGYFAGLGLRVLEGRAIDERDTATSRKVVVVNRAFARAYLDAPPVGRTLPAGTDDGTPWEVVGVVEDIRGTDTSAPPLAEMIVSSRQWPGGLSGDPAIVVRTAGDPAELTAVVRGLLRDMDPDLALADVRTMEDRVREIVATPRLYSVVVGGFAALALVIAAVGLFGVLSYAVAQRSRELAVRAALGAAPGRLVRMVMAQGLGLVAAGLVLGLGAAALLGQGLSALLFGVTPGDPLTFGGVGILLLIVGAAACLVPAARAARVAPMTLLRRG